MQKINNINKIQQEQFKGTNKMNEIIDTLNENITKLFDKLKQRAVREVADYGDFAPVIEKFANKDKSIYAGDVMLKISKPSKNIENHETKRYLEVVVKSPSDKSNASCVMEAGSKDEILKSLEDKNLLESIKSKALELAKELEADNFG